jgi:GDPmannose 4,6-dehydratase
MGKSALITGITGQDGAVLARLLLEKNYRVHGLRPYAATHDTARIDDLPLTLHYGDMTDAGSLSRVLDAAAPDEIYNLAAMSHVHVSFSMPELSANVNALGTLRLLECLRLSGARRVRFYQASSSEMFGRSPAPQNEETPFAPCSPYGVAKLYAYWTARNYRDAYGMHVSNGILFNHESAERGEEFVTRKISRGVNDVVAGRAAVLMLGCLDARRDWGHARDYMRGAWMMLQQDIPGDYVLATGVSRTVREFVTAAFAAAGVPAVWTGQGLDEKAIHKHTGQVLVKIDPSLFRPQEIHELRGDAARAARVLGWHPEISFEDMVAGMVAADREGLSHDVRFGT